MSEPVDVLAALESFLAKHPERAAADPVVDQGVAAVRHLRWSWARVRVKELQTGIGLLAHLGASDAEIAPLRAEWDLAVAHARDAESLPGIPRAFRHATATNEEEVA